MNVNWFFKKVGFTLRFSVFGMEALFTNLKNNATLINSYFSVGYSGLSGKFQSKVFLTFQKRKTNLIKIKVYISFIKNKMQ